MATVTTHEISAPRVGGRLLAAGFLLAVMAGWTAVNHEPAPTLVVAILGLAAALAAVVGVARLRIDIAAADGRRTAAIFAVLGLVAAACAVWLAIQFRLAALGESLGLGLFAVLALASALQECCANSSALGAWEKVRDARAPLGLFVAALGAVSLGSFFYLALVQKIGADFAPELFGLLIGGFVMFFAGLFLVVFGNPPPEPEKIRTLTVLVGATLGALLLLMSLVRGYLWFDDVFRGGVSALSGEGGWRFWLLAYQFLAGLGLVFASLSLAQSQVRSSATVRRTVMGYGAAVGAALALVMLIVGNVFVAKKAPYTYNWSKTRGLTSLNKGSINLLAGLTEPTSIYVLMQPSGPLFTDIRNFVGNCQAYTNKISIIYIDPKNDPAKYGKLALRFKEIDPDTRSQFDEANQGVLLVYGVMPEDVNQPVPHAFIPERRLYDIDQKGGRGSGKATLILKAESEMIRELAFLAKKSEKRKVYFLQDDGALDMNVSESKSRRNPSFDLSKVGISKLVDRLRKDNYDVRGLSFGIAPAKDKPKDIDYLGSVSTEKKFEIPDDCETLIVPGATTPISQTGLDAMERYMDQRGRMIVAFDIVTDSRFKSLQKSGMEDFVKKYGVNATDQIIYRVPQPQDLNYFGNSAKDPQVVLAEAPAKPATLLAKQFLGTPVTLWSARAVRPGTSAKYQVEPFLVVDPKRSIVWADDSVTGLVDFDRYFNDIRRSRRLESLLTREPIPVAVTVTEGMGEAAKPRMVVFGDAEFMSNEDMTISEINYDLVASSIEWMAEKGFVGPRPKESNTYLFGPEADIASMEYGPFWTMLVVISIIGVGVWLVRRK